MSAPHGIRARSAGLVERLAGRLPTRRRGVTSPAASDSGDPFASWETVVLVHRAGADDLTEPSARGVLTDPSTVFVVEPPAELLDEELVVVVCTRDPVRPTLLNSVPERHLVQRGVTWEAGGGRVAAMALRLPTPSGHPANRLGGSPEEFRTVLASGPDDLGAALVEAGQLSARQITPPDPGLRAALEATRPPVLDFPDDGDWRTLICSIWPCGPR